jgi:hypothetical protein
MNISDFQASAIASEVQITLSILPVSGCVKFAFA